MVTTEVKITWISRLSTRCQKLVQLQSNAQSSMEKSSLLVNFPTNGVSLQKSATTFNSTNFDQL